MKKVFAILLTVLAAMSFSFAESTENATSGSAFEQVLLQKGTLISKVFVPFENLNYGTSKATTEIATVTNLETGKSVSALRMTMAYYESKYDYGTATCVLDVDEIASVITTYKYIKEAFASYDSSTPYTEVVYKSNSGLKLGGYYSNGGSLFIYFDTKHSITCSSSQVDNFISFFEAAQTALNAN